MITQIINFLRKYFLIFLGLLIVLYFIWARYIRIRFSKDIPLSYLSIRGFLIITFICFIYIIIIKNLIKPRGKNNIISENIVPLFYMPLEALDKFIKQPFDMEKIILKYYKKLNYIIADTDIFYFIFAIFPRLLLITILFTDIFIFHRLHYIYYFLYIGILVYCYS